MTPGIFSGPLSSHARRPWAPLVASAAAHALLIALAAGLLHHSAESRAAEPVGSAPPRAVTMVYVPPPPPEPVVRPALPPPAEPPPPATRPTPERSEHDLPAPVVTQPVPASEPPPSAPAPSSEAPTSRPAAEPTMESEARRIFGGPRKAGTMGPLAIRGRDVDLPENPNPCAPEPAERRDAGAPPELGTVTGTVYRQGTREPLAGAFLQILGTPYVTFSDDAGDYTLKFDRSLVDHCRTQYVRVTAPGFRAQLLILSLGPRERNDIPMRRR